MSEYDSTDAAKCPYCGIHHNGFSPTVKTIEYYPDGTVKRVEFKTAADNQPLSFSPPSPNPFWPWNPIGPNTCEAAPLKPQYRDLFPLRAWT